MGVKSLKHDTSLYINLFKAYSQQATVSFQISCSILEISFCLQLKLSKEKSVFIGKITLFTIKLGLESAITLKNSLCDLIFNSLLAVYLEV